MLKKIDKEEVKKILDNHNLWIISNTKYGASAEFDSIYFSGDCYDVFCNVNLSGVVFKNCEFVFIRFINTNLLRAGISSVIFDGCYFDNVIMNYSLIMHTGFKYCDFNKVNLSESTLWDVVFKDSLKFELWFDAKSKIGNTTFANIDMSNVRNLESIVHTAPSSIGLDSFTKSRGKIPAKFLKGCGVAEVFIEYADSFNPKPIDYYSCFISYSRKDEVFVQKLYKDLQNKRIRCWLDQEDLKIGDKIRKTIHESIRIYDKLLIVLSSESINSEWVEDEVNTALDKERKNKMTCLFPIRIDDIIFKTETSWAETIRNGRHIGDFSDWENNNAYETAFKRLLRDLELDGAGEIQIGNTF